MNAFFAILICALLSSPILASPILAQSGGEQTGDPPLVSSKTRDFIKEAALSAGIELQESRLAMAKLPDGPVKDFADRMIGDHLKMLADLTRLSQAAKLQLPTALSSSQQQAVNALRALSGPQLAKRYLEDQTTTKRDAISLFQKYADAGDDDQLKAWVNDTLPVLQRNLFQAEQLDKGING